MIYRHFLSSTTPDVCLLAENVASVNRFRQPIQIYFYLYSFLGAQVGKKSYDLCGSPTLAVQVRERTGLSVNK